MEVFTLIARKKNVALVFVSYLLVALAAISLLTICIGFAPGILFAVVFGLIAYLMIMAQNTEFEYSYFDGELRFAKIKKQEPQKASWNIQHGVCSSNRTGRRQKRIQLREWK